MSQAHRGLAFGLALLLVISFDSATGSRALAEDRALTEMVPMRDGARLSTDVFLPDGEGPWPAILSRTPYGRPSARGQQEGDARGFTAAGYARVIQDTRGRFGSEGTATVFLTDGWGELQDGYDTIEWIAKQPWCDGKVGMVGGSALGITQYLAAGATPPALKCCWVSVACSSLYHFAAYPGGAFRKALIETWLKVNGFPQVTYEMVAAHPSYDAMWQTVNLEERPERVQVPMVHSGGWYDCFAQGTLNAFEALQHRGGEGAKGNQVLVFGPWVHGLRTAGEISFPPQAKENPLKGLERAFFDHYLRGKPTPLEQVAPVNYYVMGDCDDLSAPGNEWRQAEDWPVPAMPVAYYLHRDRALSSDKSIEGKASLSYDFDPANPVPTVGGANLVLSKGPMDQRKVESRPDVLLFQTQPLGGPMEVTGRVTARLWVSSSAPDTDFTAKLTDVYPDGRSMILCDGILRARYRNSVATPELMEPGKVYEVAIDLWSTSVVINKGHRIRLAISSSNYPRFEVNPNTGEPGIRPDNPKVAHNTVHLDAEHPSHVILPLVPR